ncbi:MAG: GNAT family N-acetyltransferase [Anaerolineae bacterium]
MIFVQPSRLTVRRARRADVTAINRLIESSWATHTRLLPNDLEAGLEQYIAFVTEDQVALRGFMMVEPQPPQASLIVATALHDNSRPGPFLGMVIPALETELRRQGLTYVLQIGEAAWLTGELPRYGFKVIDRVMTFEWRRQPLPAVTPHPRLRIRTAHQADLPGLLALDRLAFGRVWQKPRPTFRQALSRAAVFSVGVIGQTIVAYQWCDRFGDHGHLTRLATHPHLQRRGIGAQLLRHALQTLLELGVNTVSLNTQTGNLNSQELYRRFGFAPTNQVIDVFCKEIAG